MMKHFSAVFVGVTTSQAPILIPCSDVDPHWSNADPGPQNSVIADPDPGR